MSPKKKKPKKKVTMKRAKRFIYMPGDVVIKKGNK